MKKYLSIFVVFGIIISLLVGCGKEELYIPRDVEEVAIVENSNISIQTEKDLVYSVEEIINAAKNEFISNCDEKIENYPRINVLYSKEEKEYRVDFCPEKIMLGGDIEIILNEDDLSLINIIYGE